MGPHFKDFMILLLHSRKIWTATTFGRKTFGRLTFGQLAVQIRDLLAHWFLAKWQGRGCVDEKTVRPNVFGSNVVAPKFDVKEKDSWVIKLFTAVIYEFL